MSAPEPDIETQTRRHAGPLIGMAAVVVFAGLLFVWWMAYEVQVPDQPLPDTVGDTAPGQNPSDTSDTGTQSGNN